MTFCTAINCMDGRTQLPVIRYLQQHYLAPFVDMITEPGPVRVLAETPDGPLTASILNRIRISIEAHASTGLAVIAHADCAGNPVADNIQIEHLHQAAALLSRRFPALPLIRLWVSTDGTIREIN